MKRSSTLTTLVIVFASVLLAVLVIRRGNAGLVPKVHAQEGCSLATLQGDYLVTGGAQARIDQSDDPTFPRVSLAVHIFDGNGGLTGSTAMSHGGEILVVPNLEATYTLDSDCTGFLTFAGGEGARWRIVVTRDGREGDYIRIDPGTIATRHIIKR